VVPDADARAAVKRLIPHEVVNVNEITVTYHAEWVPEQLAAWAEHLNQPDMAATILDQQINGEELQEASREELAELMQEGFSTLCFVAAVWLHFIYLHDVALVWLNRVLLRATFEHLHRPKKHWDPPPPPLPHTHTHTHIHTHTRARARAPTHLLLLRFLYTPASEC
jgi:hypothetical protein